MKLGMHCRSGRAGLELCSRLCPRTVQVAILLTKRVAASRSCLRRKSPARAGSRYDERLRTGPAYPAVRTCSSGYLGTSAAQHARQQASIHMRVRQPTQLLYQCPAHRARASIARRRARSASGTSAADTPGGAAATPARPGSALVPLARGAAAPGPAPLPDADLVLAGARSGLALPGSGLRPRLLRSLLLRFPFLLFAFFLLPSSSPCSPPRSRDLRLRPPCAAAPPPPPSERRSSRRRRRPPPPPAAAAPSSAAAPPPAAARSPGWGPGCGSAPNGEAAGGRRSRSTSSSRGSGARGARIPRSRAGGGAGAGSGDGGISPGSGSSAGGGEQRQPVPRNGGRRVGARVGRRGGRARLRALGEQLPRQPARGRENCPIAAAVC